MSILEPSFGIPPRRLMRYLCPQLFLLLLASRVPVLDHNLKARPYFQFFRRIFWPVLFPLFQEGDTVFLSFRPQISRLLRLQTQFRVFFVFASEPHHFFCFILDYRDLRRSIRVSVVRIFSQTSSSALQCGSGRPYRKR